MDRLHCDLFHQDRLLLNGVGLRIKLDRAKGAFCIMSGAGGVKYKILTALFYLRRVYLSDTVFTAHQRALGFGPAKYPITRVLCTYFQIPGTNTSYHQDNLFGGQMPTRVIIGLVDAAAFNGSYQKNPFFFKHRNTTKAELSIGGMSESLKGLQLNFPNQSLLSYLGYLIGTGKWGKDVGSDFDREDYKDGYSLFAWNLTPDLAEGQEHFQLRKDLSVRLDLTFNTPLPVATNCIVYAEFENLILIDKHRNVTTNFA